MIKTSAIVVAELVSAADVVAMKPIVARINTTAIAMTYPRIGRVVSIRPIQFQLLVTDVELGDSYGLY